MKPSKALARPVLHDMAALRRVVKYVAGTMEMELFLEPELRDKHLLEVWVDTDYAGDKVTRRSIGSTIARLDGVLLHCHSKQQTVVATSSAEAEYYGIAAGLAEGMAVRQFLSELNNKLDLVVRCDSSSGRAMSLKQGFGRVKHIDVKMCWVQKQLDRGVALLRAAQSLDNLADIGTKSLGRDRLLELTYKIGLR